MLRNCSIALCVAAAAAGSCLTHAASARQSSRIVPEYFDKVLANGRGAPLLDWPRIANSCRRRVRIKRGEYETRAEFEARRTKMKSKMERCKEHWPLRNARVIKPVSLSYNADGGFFTFSVKLGGAAYPRHLKKGFVYTRELKKHYRRLCNAGLQCRYKHRKGGFKHLYNIVCWTTAGQKIRAEGMNKKRLDGWGKYRIHQSIKYQHYTKRTGTYGQIIRRYRRPVGLRDFGTCTDSVDWNMWFRVKADIHKARQLKRDERHLRMEFVGNSDYIRKHGSRVDWRVHVYRVHRLRLFNSKSGNTLFSLGFVRK